MLCPAKTENVRMFVPRHPIDSNDINLLVWKPENTAYWVLCYYMDSSLLSRQAVQ
jgi:hypothetical protein